ncbi:MAG: hypothetical protein V3V91_01555, partial [Thermoplasmata archaeon]
LHVGKVPIIVKHMLTLLASVSLVSALLSPFYDSLTFTELADRLMFRVSIQGTACSYHICLNWYTHTAEMGVAI